jgi:hypothetical protein
MKSEGQESSSIVYWLFFEVGIPLAPLYLLIPLAFFLSGESWQWADIVADGSLLFYATTIASKAAGEHLKDLDARSQRLCLGISFLIAILSAFIYALIVMTSFLNFNSALSPKRVAVTSTGLAISSLILSFVLRLRTRLPKVPEVVGFGIVEK